MKAFFITTCVLLAVSVAAASPGLHRQHEADLPNDVTFHLYTIYNPDAPQIIRIGDYLSLNSSNFDAFNETKFVIHGHTENIESASIQNIKDAYMRLGQGHNVIGVDWDLLAAPVYNTARGNVVAVGEYVALFMDFLVTDGGAEYTDFHALGHDLGAHVAGVAAFNSGHLIARVTGLDPSLAGYDTELPENMINPFDAKYVDIIHTDGGEHGFMNPLGDADFYPNGGVRIQSGCGTVDPEGACSHSASYIFYSYSIEDPLAFEARRCATLEDIQTNGNCDTLASGLMGEGSDEATRGLYHLRARVVNPE